MWTRGRYRVTAGPSAPPVLAELREPDGMCRSIVTLRRPESATTDEIHAAALQFVRKVSGSRQPCGPNQGGFERAVDEISASVQRLLDELVTPVPAPSRAAPAGA